MALVLKDRETEGAVARARKLGRRDLERSDLRARDEAIEMKLEEHETHRKIDYAYCEKCEPRRWVYRKGEEECGRFQSVVGEGSRMWSRFSVRRDDFGSPFTASVG